MTITSLTGRYTAVSTVLRRVLWLNLAVAVAKIALGLTTGAISILSDGFHSLTDTASNVVALVGIRIARKPPDEDHPYGHRKYETIASVGITLFLLIVMLEVVWAAVSRLRGGGGEPSVTPLSFGVMAATFAVNLVVVRYEARAAARLSSEVLLADAVHTRSDLATSIGVTAALAGVAMGFPILDPIAGLVVAAFIGRAAFQVGRETSKVLSDRMVIAEEDLSHVVRGVPGVLGCHRIRTRGSADHVFVDLHVWLDGDTPLMEAHRVSHVVKDQLIARYPQIADAVIHIEPPPAGWNHADADK